MQSPSGLKRPDFEQERGRTNADADREPRAEPEMGVPPLFSDHVHLLLNWDPGQEKAPVGGSLSRAVLWLADARALGQPLRPEPFSGHTFLMRYLLRSRHTTSLSVSSCWDSTYVFLCWTIHTSFMSPQLSCNRWRFTDLVRFPGAGWLALRPARSRIIPSGCRLFLAVPTKTRFSCRHGTGQDSTGTPTARLRWRSHSNTTPTGLQLPTPIRPMPRQSFGGAPNPGMTSADLGIFPEVGRLDG